MQAILSFNLSNIHEVHAQEDIYIFHLVTILIVSKSIQNQFDLLSSICNKTISS